jgi:hypothetical protein
LLHTPLLKIRRPGGPHSVTASNLERPFPVLDAAFRRPTKMSNIPEWLSAEGRRFQQYTRPCLSWDEVQKLCSGHLEVQRFLRLRKGIRASAWYQRRSHAPCDLDVPTDWGLDSLYFRHACKEEYGRQLRELVENPENTLMGNHLICFPNTWVPHC